MLHLGRTAKHIREKKGMTQRAAAEALKISYVHLSNIENNKSPVSAALLERYKALWGIDLYILAWCLFGDVDDLPESVRAPLKLVAENWLNELADYIPEKS